MAMYAMALTPLVKLLQPNCKQVWYADDATGCDRLEKLKVWYDKLLSEGPNYGYYLSPSKCILVVKPSSERMQKIFKNSGSK